ncbi:hypothetical protein ADK86_11680 [Streptomyces sp. NRRL F-5755]|uniref:hypothetical protein n=1 Tax=Streptomyces sp. NRRL F-5755 TaxID=1519475 RepID=UPI0006AF4C2C|nr:hypothetical protein [Streptomyces sp. NRRL F-5755]KOU01838.1 hypothetical protein ADK86_11680 [Streptomyces sp. NRRL F-5755]
MRTRRILTAVTLAATTMLGCAGITAAAADAPETRQDASAAQSPSHQMAEIKGTVTKNTHMYKSGKPVQALKTGDVVVLKCWIHQPKKEKFYHVSFKGKDGYVVATAIKLEGAHEPPKCK